MRIRIRDPGSCELGIRYNTSDPQVTVLFFVCSEEHLLKSLKKAGGLNYDKAYIILAKVRNSNFSIVFI
jgi:hypothetical protein